VGLLELDFNGGEKDHDHAANTTGSNTAAKDAEALA
jgi:hypothetical protein